MDKIKADFEFDRLIELNQKKAWSVVKGATGYQVFRLNSKTGKYEKIADVKGGTNVTYKDGKRKKGTTETYKVRAYKRYDESIYWGTSSPVAKIKVK